MVYKCCCPEECADILKAIAEETRIKILRFLLNKEGCVNEIAKELNMKQYHVSRHLTVLKKAGLVRALREGKNVKYSINPEISARSGKDIVGSIDIGCCTISFRPLPEKKQNIS
jgi:ArsR family transcriptional regulator